MAGERVGAARSGLDGARRGALQGDQLIGRVLDRTSTTRSEMSERCGNRDADKGCAETGKEVEGYVRSSEEA